MNIDDIGLIGFIGAGRMATAIAAGLVQSGVPTESMLACDTSEKAAERFTAATGINTTTDSMQIIDAVDTIVIAVKPQSLHEALIVTDTLKPKLLISILAGVRLKTLMDISGCKRVVRVMPNTPALVGEAISAYAPSSYVDQDDLEKTQLILNSFGQSCMISEHLMDAVTGLSGSGPAYVFDFIQALADGGVNAGLPRDVAKQLAAQTVLGAAKMVLETDTHPTELKDQVTSPAGTTAKALAVLEKGGFRGLVSEAVIASAERSAELGKLN